ncbi:hypothetical protein D0868_10331 [Hortaea werneckii]|uniref:Uncharacterized protein n=1 Tax=Hortaea werneckii TaxID=91943 RepID=A0A3M6Y5H8_HORWE|nr:hypothetical protein D0868_10331 [Hortaea werneckii]
MSFPAHWEIVDVLTELYVLLDTLAAVPPSLLRLPPAETGTHPVDVFNAEAAKAAGFSSEAVKVLSALPYLDDIVLIAPSTTTMNYYGQGRDTSLFEEDRELVYDERLAPPSVIQLTASEGGYGCIYIYDAETRKMFPWTPMYEGSSAADNEEDDSDRPDYLHVEPRSPREALQPLIDKFRRLQYINMPLSGDTNHLLFEDTLDIGVSNTPTKEELQRYVGKDYYRRWQVSRELKEIYLDCGWKVDAVEQLEFRRDEFLERRRRHLANARRLATD